MRRENMHRATTISAVETREESFFPAVFSALHYPVLCFTQPPDKNGALKIIYVNDAFCSTFCHDAETVIGNSPTLLYRPDTYGMEMEQVYHALRDGVPVTVELKLYRGDGSFYWSEVCFTPLVLQKPKSKHAESVWMCLYFNINQRKEVEGKLWETIHQSQLHNITLQRALDREIVLHQLHASYRDEMQLETICMHAATALSEVLKAERCLVFLREGDQLQLRAQKIFESVPAVAEILPIPLDSTLVTQIMKTESKVLNLEEITDDKWFGLAVLMGKLKPARSLLACAVADEDYIHGMIVMQQCTTRRKWHAHEIVLVEAAGRELEDAVGRARIRQELLHARAVAEEKAQKLEESLEKEKQLTSLQADFISMASHELRTPLAIIDSAVQLTRRAVRKAGSEASYMEKQLDKIHKAVVRMDLLVSGTLSLSRLDMGRVQFNPSHFNLRQLVEDIVQRHVELSGNIELKLDIDILPARFWGDAMLLDQVITNLITNAIKYSRTHGCVVVSGEANPLEVRIKVCDEGIGVPPEDLPKLFDKFVRASNTTGTPGTGIGLYIARMLTEMHGGQLTVQSTLGHGSTFCISLSLTEHAYGKNPVH